MLKTSFPNSAFSYGFGSDVFTGNRFYLNSGAANASDGNTGLRPGTPFATLDHAFSQCTADNGDVIYPMVGHSETITGAAGIAHDVAGVSVIGLGHGGQRPTFLMDAGTAVTYKITANDAFVSNLILNAGYDDIVTCIDVQNATDAWIDRIAFTDNAGSENYLTCIKSGTSTDNECDGLRITNCTWFSVDTGSLEFYEMLGDTDRFVCTGNYVHTLGTASPLVLCTAGDDMQDCFIADNFLINKMTANDLMIDNDQSDNTGIISGNKCFHADVSTSHDLIDADGCGMFDNLSTSVTTKSGFVLPDIDADS